MLCAMTKKTNVIALIALHPHASADILASAQPRRFRARRVLRGFELQNGALDLGFVPGDCVTVSQAIDGIRYIDGIQKLRKGTLSQIDIRTSRCAYPRAETMDQLTEELQAEGALAVAERAGRVYAFWPGSISIEDVGGALSRSTTEFPLPARLMPTSARHSLIVHCADLSPGEEQSPEEDHRKAA